MTPERVLAHGAPAGGAVAPDRVGLRPVGADDDVLVRVIFASSRSEELALTGWTDEQRAAFVDFQVRAQTADYARRFPDGRHSIVLVDGEAAGRVWVHRGDDELRLLDITLLPAWRGRGVGTVVLRGLQQEAAAHGVPVCHTVLRENTGARRLYRRLGFVDVDATATHVLMRWTPGA